MCLRRLRFADAGWLDHSHNSPWWYPDEQGGPVDYDTIAEIKARNQRREGAEDIMDEL